MIYTVVYVNDDHWPACYGQFSSRPAAEKFAEKLERSLDAERDPAGGGVGNVAVCLIQRRSDWMV